MLLNCPMFFFFCNASCIKSRFSLKPIRIIQLRPHFGVHVTRLVVATEAGDVYLIRFRLFFFRVIIGRKCKFNVKT